MIGISICYRYIYLILYTDNSITTGHGSPRYGPRVAHPGVLCQVCACNMI